MSHRHPVPPPGLRRNDTPVVRAVTVVVVAAAAGFVWGRWGLDLLAGLTAAAAIPAFLATGITVQARARRRTAREFTAITCRHQVARALTEDR